MPKNLTYFLRYSTGALFLAAATALLIGIDTTNGMYLPRDPVFLLPLRSLFWGVCGICLYAGIFNIFFGVTFVRLMWVAFVATILTIYFVACVWYTGPDLRAYLWSLSGGFALSTKTMNLFVEFILGYLFFGSHAAVVSFFWRNSRGSSTNCIKMFCTSCRGHIEFNVRNLGEEIPCPHCKTVVELRRSENYKMSCYFCDGHIEFPLCFVGERLKCPHCGMEITLAAR